MISFPVPALCQYADEELMLEVGSVVFPGFLERPSGENGLRMWADGSPKDSAARDDALGKFHTMLGILRAWKPEAGELREEMRAGVGVGSVRDRQGNQYVSLGPAVDYTTLDREIETLADHARRGVDASINLCNALWLNGRLNRNAADYYMIHEYAKMEFGSREGIKDALGLSMASQSSLTKSANNLSPLAGGRHAIGDPNVADMSLGQQRAYIAKLLRKWIARYS